VSLLVVAGMTALLLMSGCQNGKVSGVKTDPTRAMPEVVPTYDEIARVQNARVGKIDRYWSAIRMKLKWFDEVDESWREESGEGHLIFQRPRNVALTFSKVGEIGFWAGSNDEMFWVFEGGDDPQEYVARNENAFQPCCEALPISVHPLELIDLVGLFPFPTFSAEGSYHLPPAVRYSSQFGAWMIDLPGLWSIRRVYLDPETLLPIRVELRLRADCEVELGWAELSNYRRMDVRGLEDEDQPLVPGKMVVSQPTSKSEVTLETIRPMDRTARGPIRVQAFQLKAISRSMKPRRRRVLDAGCSNPAFPE